MSNKSIMHVLKQWSLQNCYWIFQNPQSQN